MALILFIDDNQDTLDLLAQAAWLVGHSSISSLTLDHGMQLAHTHPPDVIFIDFNLPTISGDKMVSQIRQSNHLSKTPIVVLSAAMTREQTNLAISAGANLCLQKPISLKELSQAVDSFFQI